jgi:tetratricopeptide (TPR) repeat protein
VNNPRIGDILTTAAIKLSNRFTGDTATKAEIHATLGRTYAALSDYRNAEKHFREAISLSATDPTDKGLMLQARYELVNVLSQTGAMTEAKSLLDETNAAAGDLRTVPSALGMQAALANGNYYDSLSDIDQALLQYEAAERMRRVAAPLDTKWLFKIRLSLIGEYIGKRRYREAEILNADLIRPDLTLDAVGAVNWGRSRWCYAEILAQEKRYPEAERLDQEAVGGMRARLGREHFYTGAALSELSNLLVDEGKFAEALEPAANAFDIMQKTLGTQSQDAILAHVNVGILEFRSGHTAAGLNDLTVARAQLVQLLGVENPLAQQADFYLATALNESGRSAEAWDYATHLSVDALSNGGEGSPEWGARLDGLKGQILLKRGKHAEALALLQPAVQKMTASNVPSWIVDPVKTSLDEATLPAPLTKP